MPVAKAPAAPTYSGSRSRWPTSTATRPRGSKPAGDQGQPGGGPGHHAGRPGERAQRQQLAVHDGGQHQRRDRGAAGDQPGQSRPAGRATTGSATGPPQLGVRRTTSRAASTCSRASTWRGAFGQRSLSPGSAAATRSAPCSTGSVTVPARTASRSYAGPPARRWPPRSAGRPRPRPGRRAGAARGGRSAWSTRSRARSTAARDVGELEQRGERIRGHARHASDRTVRRAAAVRSRDRRHRGRRAATAAARTARRPRRRPPARAVRPVWRRRRSARRSPCALTPD